MEGQSVNGLTIDTNCGRVEGFEEDGVRKWFGVPFAAPPTGALRFKRATECEPWGNVKETKKFGNRPIQFMKMNRRAEKASVVAQSEDCLYLNIWAPKEARDCPVFVYIFGGGNTVGEASDPMYSCEAFTGDGVIGVNFNYRVGPLGFYDFSKYSDAFDSNCAVSDMIAAVKWIKENIAAFGGDPNNITICGESAGGTGVYALLAAPSAAGYFNKAIAMSGLAGNVTSGRTQELNNGIFFEHLDISDKDAGTLKNMSVARMLPAAHWVYAKNCSVYPGIFISGPVIDDLIPRKPWDAMATGSAADKKVIFGSCHDEGTLFYMMKMFPRTWDEVKRMLELSGQSDKFSVLHALYAKMGEKKALTALDRDRAFWVDHVKCTLAQSRHNTTYAYRFDFAYTLMKIAGLGAMHGSDIGCGLGTTTGAMNQISVFTSQKRKKKIRGEMHGAFVNFVKSGDPNGALSVKWPTYTEDERATYIFNDTCSIERDPNRAAFDVWKDVVLYEGPSINT
jgi:para-nitrobenzyl esterase